MAGAFTATPVMGNGGLNWSGAIDISGNSTLDFPGFVQGVNFCPKDCLIDNTMNSSGVMVTEVTSGKQFFVGAYSMGVIPMQGSSLNFSGIGLVKFSASSKGIEIMGNVGVVRAASAGVGGATKSKTINKSLLAYEPPGFGFYALNTGEVESYVKITSFSYSFGNGGAPSGYVQLSIDGGATFFDLVRVQNGVVVSPVPTLPYTLNINAGQSLMYLAYSAPYDGNFTMTLSYL